MNVVNTNLPKVRVVETQFLKDARGSFARLFCREELRAVLGDSSIVQINQSVTLKKGTIRGMHLQFPPAAEMKLVRCLKGRVFDVAVDLRAASPTFLHWHAQELTPENGRMLVVPEGCAHGFQTLEDDCELLYLHTAYYEPQQEGGFLFNDAAFGIDWPLACTELSAKDASYAKLGADFQGIQL